MQTLDFYFDIISPYACFAFKRLDDLPSGVEIHLKPVLFAGLLGHWESKGPAEIPPKRIFTYQYTHWYAKHHEIAFRAPPAHPFNPLPGLRLAIAAGCERGAVDQIFSFVWAKGLAFDDQSAWDELLTTVDGNAEAVGSAEVKNQLRENTEQALAANVFGVPTYVIDGNVFWGVDSLEMVKDYLANPAMMDDPEMQRLANLPSSATRKF